MSWMTDNGQTLFRAMLRMIVPEFELIGQENIVSAWTMPKLKRNTERAENSHGFLRSRVLVSYQKKKPPKTPKEVYYKKPSTHREREREREMEGREDQKGLDGLRDQLEEEEEERGKKKVKYVSYLTELDMKIEQPLREQDPIRFKREIRRWAHAVVRYARQLSRSLSSSSFSRGRRSSVSSFRFDEDEDKDFGNSA
ncbi:uncharacterized protein LOC110095856 [Dendrobium catenatum]|uniref:uncharacterized protein LOC110095856 n=1 Tax=Dendrobium catenatum TaxID=906689 RepID=UPI0009F43747|nr:uncharacterized protein LOC110095856 [Dendrobium catenatum]